MRLEKWAQMVCASRKDDIGCVRRRKFWSWSREC